MSVIMIVFGGRRCGGGLNHVCRHHKPPLSFIDYRYEVILRRGHVCRGGMLRGVAVRGEASCHCRVYLFIYVMLVRELLWLLVDEKTGGCGDRRHLYARGDRVWAAFAVAPCYGGTPFLQETPLESWPTDAWRGLSGCAPGDRIPKRSTSQDYGQAATLVFPDLAPTAAPHWWVGVCAANKSCIPMCNVNVQNQTHARAGTDARRPTRASTAKSDRRCHGMQSGVDVLRLYRTANKWRSML